MEQRIQVIVLRALEWLVGLALGLVVGFWVVWLPPGLMWPGVAGTIALIVAGKMIFEGIFPGFGYGVVNLDSKLLRAINDGGVPSGVTP